MLFRSGSAGLLGLRRRDGILRAPARITRFSSFLHSGYPSAKVCPMSIYLGLDVGSVSVELAAIGTPEDAAALDGLARHSSAFLGVDGAATGRPVLVSAYRRILGTPLQAALDLLDQFHAAVPASAVAGMRLTGSGGRLVARHLDVPFENEFKEIGRAHV